jgi:hypothetical protein
MLLQTLIEASGLDQAEVQSHAGFVFLPVTDNRLSFTQK